MIKILQKLRLYDIIKAMKIKRRTEVTFEQGGKKINGVVLNVWEAGGESFAWVLDTDGQLRAVKISNCEVVQSEDDLQKQVKSFCRKAGHKMLHLKKGRDGTSRTQQAGWPDCVIAQRNTGVTFYIELKTTDGKLRKEQKAFKLWCRDNGHRYEVCRTVDEVKQILGGDND